MNIPTIKFFPRIFNILTEKKAVLYELRKCLLCHSTARTQQNSDFGKLGSKELNDMAPQPNCALWTLHIAAGNSPGAFLLHPAYELYVQR